MFNARQDLVSVLLRRGIVSQEQLDEARRLQQQAPGRLEDLLIRLGHVSAAEVAIACAECMGLCFLDLSIVSIPPAVIELVPESVARENCILPVALDGEVLVVAIADPADVDTLQKLEFILNRPVRPVLACREEVIEAINRHYGETETEAVVSMLMEFTDTAIDFTETESSENSGIDLECDDMGLGDEESGSGVVALEDEEREAEAIPVSARLRCSKPRLVDRRATVRYYQRMNPERLFPLLVILSEKTIQEVVRRGVAQKHSDAFQVAEDSVIEIEPVLPGCDCYPPREQVRVGRGEVTANFWVVPHVLGRLMHARVIVRQGDRVLAEVSLEARVVKQSLALLMGALSLILPFGLLLLKQMHLDFETQMQEGFGLYAQLTGWLLHALTPELLTGLLLAATVAVYLVLRPRKRDVFWDVTTADPDETAASKSPPALTVSDTVSEDLATLLERADRSYKARDFATAFRLYERAGAGSLRAVHYFRAALAAHHCGNTARALGILKQAEARLPAKEMKGPLWYNMGCFATCLGRFAEALHYLNRAVDAGYDDPEKYRCDPDLEPLRWQPGFKRLLVGLGC